MQKDFNMKRENEKKKIVRKKNNKLSEPEGINF